MLLATDVVDGVSCAGLVGVDGVAGADGVGPVATPGLAGLAVAAGDSARAPAAAAFERTQFFDPSAFNSPVMKNFTMACYR